MWLPRRDDVDAGGQDRVRRRRRQAHPAGDVLAVGGDEVDAALVAQAGQDLLDRDPAGLADHVADHQDAARPLRARGVAVGRVAEARPADGAAIGIGIHVRIVAAPRVLGRGRRRKRAIRPSRYQRRRFRVREAVATGCWAWKAHLRSSRVRAISPRNGRPSCVLANHSR